MDVLRVVDNERDVSNSYLGLQDAIKNSHLGLLLTKLRKAVVLMMDEGVSVNNEIAHPLHVHVYNPIACISGFSN